MTGAGWAPSLAVAVRAPPGPSAPDGSTGAAPGCPWPSAPGGRRPHAAAGAAPAWPVGLRRSRSRSRSTVPPAPSPAEPAVVPGAATGWRAAGWRCGAGAAAV